jgi:ABC-type Zn uptake system ZnuABC Zn-binding protein ZnuA
VCSNPNVWFWNTNYGKLIRIFRALDTLIPISKSVSFSKMQKENGLLCVPASRFFRPYKHSEDKIKKLKLSRIKGEMSYAAKKNKNYHLWWHPHNFGEDVENNKKQLLEIIEHYKFLKDKYNFSSANMLDLAK